MMSENKYICSPMNYIGGKYKLLPQIQPYIPSGINTFVDLFCGGCNVGINQDAKKIWFNDNLSYLIDLYQTFSSFELEDIKRFIHERIETLGLNISNVEAYNKLRCLYNENRNPLDLFVLVAFSFNHQIRFNNSHEFNCPFGKNRSCYNQRMEQNLINFVDRLHSVKHCFTATNFDEFDFSSLTSEDFVYCDPPYLITTGSYNDGKRGFTGWGKAEEMKLLSILSNLHERNIRFALSNVVEHKGLKNNILLDWSIENKFIVNHLDKDYKNSNYQTKNTESETKEVLITNYEVHWK